MGRGQEKGEERKGWEMGKRRAIETGGNGAGHISFESWCSLFLIPHFGIIPYCYFDWNSKIISINTFLSTRPLKPIHINTNREKKNLLRVNT